MGDEPALGIPETMRSTGFGGLDKLVYRSDVPVQNPLAEDVLVKVDACGINNTDINLRTRWYHPAGTGSLSEIVSDTGVALSEDATAPDASIAGAACAYAGRCAVQLGETCLRTTPITRILEQGVGIVCHKTLAELAFTSPGHTSQNEAPGPTNPLMDRTR